MNTWINAGARTDLYHGRHLYHRLRFGLDRQHSCAGGSFCWLRSMVGSPKGGAFYIWPSKEAAQRGHDAEWFANIKVRTGSVPTIRYFDLTMIVDNEAGSVTEFQCRGAIG
jgi:hypothetical protein